MFLVVIIKIPELIGDNNLGFYTKLVLYVDGKDVHIMTVYNTFP